MPAAQPNILFIIADQHHRAVMGHEGHPDVLTPHLDRLAAEGLRFRNAICQNPICTPSRTCFLSGQYCHNHGTYGLSGPRPQGLPTMFGHFRQHGYRTAAIGKIHCPEYWVEDDCDVFHETCECSIGGRSGVYTRFLKEHDAEFREDHTGFHDMGPRGRQTMDGRPSMATYEESQEGWVAATVGAFMAESKAMGKPFIVQASLPKPHQTYAPAQEFWDLYDPAKLTLPPNADIDLSGKAPHLQQSAERFRSGNWTIFEPKTFEAGRLRKLRGYLGNVSQVDRAVGDLLASLEANGLAENTIVIYTADHGDYVCQFDLMEKAPGICGDAITRIPMIWRVPGLTPAGHEVVEELVESVDLSATFCALAGVAPMPTSDGHDITHLLRGESGAVREVAVTEFAWSKSLRKGRHRLVWYPRAMFPQEHPEGFGELYDLEADPWEMQNLYFDPAHAATVRELERDLLDWLVTTTRPVNTNGAGHWEGHGAVTRFKCTVAADGKLPSAQLHKVQHRNYL